jgi:hypothetical protein
MPSAKGRSGIAAMAACAALAAVPAGASAQSAAADVYLKPTPITPGVQVGVQVRGSSSPVRGSTTNAPATPGGAGPNGRRPAAGSGGDGTPSPGADGVNGGGGTGGTSGGGTGQVRVPGAAALLDYAIIDVGGRDAALTRLVTGTLGAPLYEGTVRQVDLEGLAAELRGTRFAGLGDDEDLLAALGRRLGRDAVDTGPVLPRVLEDLFAEFRGRLGRPSAVIFTNIPGDLSPAARATLDLLTEAMVKGIGAQQIPNVFGDPVDVPVIGVETTTTTPSRIAWFKARGIPATVDNLDQPLGQATLLRLVDGVEGHFGVKPSADGAAPSANLAGTSPLRFRRAGALSAPQADAASPVTAGTIGILALAGLAAGGALGYAGRRTLLRRLTARA